MEPFAAHEPSWVVEVGFTIILFFGLLALVEIAKGRWYNMKSKTKVRFAGALVGFLVTPKVLEMAMCAGRKVVARLRGK